MKAPRLPGTDRTTTRRDFLGAVAISTAGVAGGLGAGCATRGPAAKPGPHLTEPDVSVLPKGPAPAPLSPQHFPSRIHAFIWRNWQLVPVQRMAEVIGATPADIRSVAGSMGLSRQPQITAAQSRRSYISVIKRNWHLLPYEQLLSLLGWTAEDLAFTLREDDFLWAKLGALKPRCEPLRWIAPDAEQTRRARAIAEVIRQEFGQQDVCEPKEPLFSFVSQLSSPAAAPHQRPATTRLRFCYSYFALYGDPLLNPDLDPYPDGYLERLADCGVNGVWLQAVLHKLAPFPWQPSLSARHAERLPNLSRLVARAQKHGIQIFLYLNEPRSMPSSFFTSHPELKGATEGDHAAICTTVPEVRRWLEASTEHICRSVPALGGFFTITASENLSNCWSHGGGKTCPRCASRAPAEVIAEVNATLQHGIQAAGHDQRLIAWDWGWNDAWAPEIIARLPQGVTLMSVSEWGLPIERGGVKSTVGEYSLSAIGPGPRAKKHWALARARGLKTIAKIQAGNTWELSAVPWIPVAANAAEHARRLRELDLDGVMLGWTLGGYPSPNLEAVAEGMAGGTLDPLAERRFGRDLAPAVVRAWQALGNAFAEFPFDIGVVYGAPLQTGPANLLWPEPTHYARTMVGFGYDDLAGWRSQYPEETFITQLEKVAAGFDAAHSQLGAAVAAPGGGTSSQRRAARDELTMIRTAAIHWRSVANQARFIRARNSVAQSTAVIDTTAARSEMRRVLREEIRLARELHAIQSADSRIGFEATNQYYYVPLDLVEKVLNCRYLLGE